MPSSLDEAVQVAINVSNAERVKQTDTKRVLSTKATNFPKQLFVSIAGNENTMRKTLGLRERMITPKAMFGPGKWQVVGGSEPPAHVLRYSSTPGLPKGKAIRCVQCSKMGHRLHQCPKLVGSNKNKSTQTTAVRQRYHRSRPGYHRRGIRL